MEVRSRNRKAIRVLNFGDEEWACFIVAWSLRLNPIREPPTLMVTICFMIVSKCWIGLKICGRMSQRRVTIKLNWLGAWPCYCDAWLWGAEDLDGSQPEGASYRAPYAATQEANCSSPCCLLLYTNGLEAVMSVRLLDFEKRDHLWDSSLYPNCLLSALAVCLS